MGAATSAFDSPRTTMGIGESMAINWASNKTDSKLSTRSDFDTSGRLLFELAINRHISNYKLAEMNSRGQMVPIRSDMTEDDNVYMYLAELFRRMDTLLGSTPHLLECLSGIDLNINSIITFKDSNHDYLSALGLSGVPVEEFLEYARFRNSLQEEG